MNRTLPNLFIIGAMKSGTSSLHNYLALHPEICMSTIKEPDFFMEEGTWHKGLEWYKSIFPGTAKILGESSTSYSKYPTYQGVPEKMAQHAPDAKLIYILRDPIRRIVSQYMHMVVHHGEKRAFEEAVTANGQNEYLINSRYYLQLERYLNCFSRDQMMVVEFEDFSRNTKSVMRQIFAFLGVDEKFESEAFSVKHHQSSKKRKQYWLKKQVQNLRGSYRLEQWAPWLFGAKISKPALNDSIAAKLKSALQEDIDKLRTFTGLTFEAWSL
ncbi:MAG: sulfotransferase [bacterium]